MIAFLLSPLGLRIIGALAICAALAAGYHHIWHNGYEDGAHEIQVEWDKDKAMRMKLQEDLAEAYRQKSLEAQTHAKERDDARSQLLIKRKSAVSALPPAIAGINIPASAVQLLNPSDSDAKATGASAKSEQGSTPASGDTTLGLLAGWIVEVEGMYGACRDEVIGWQAFYQSLRESHEP